LASGAEKQNVNPSIRVRELESKDAQQSNEDPSDAEALPPVAARTEQPSLQTKEPLTSYELADNMKASPQPVAAGELPGDRIQPPTLAQELPDTSSPLPETSATHLHELDVSGSGHELDSQPISSPLDYEQPSDADTSYTRSGKSDTGDSPQSERIAPSPHGSTPSLDANRIKEIEAAKAKLQERKRRLMELQQVEAEEDRLNEELTALRAGSSWAEGHFTPAKGSININQSCNLRPMRTWRRCLSSVLYFLRSGN
jgi:hypothetical protein